MTDENTIANHQPQQLETKPRTYGSVAMRELAEDEIPLAKVLPAGGPLLGRQQLAESFNKGAQTLEDAAESARAMASGMEQAGQLLTAPECRRCPGCTNQGACHSDEGGAA